MSAFDRLRIEDSDIPARLPSGAPWVRWVKLDERRAGWYAQGARQMLRTGSFWENVLVGAVAVTGFRLDRVHAIGDAQIAMGALGCTLVAETASLLLYEGLRRHPEHFLHCWAPVLDKRFWYPTSLGLRGASGERVHDWPLGADDCEWAKERKSDALIWVSSASRWLRHEIMDAVQQEVASLTLPSLVPEELRFAVRWAEDGAEAPWQYTKERQLLWAYLMVVAATGLTWPVSGLVGGEPTEALDEIWVVSGGPDDPRRRALRTLGPAFGRVFE